MLTPFQVEKPRTRAALMESHPAFLPLSVARMIWKRKLAIGVFAIASCLLTTAAVRRLPSIYVSEALVLIESQKIPEKFVSSTIATDLQDRLAAISQRILSTGRLEQIISAFNLYQSERQTLAPEEVLTLMRKDLSIQMDRDGSGKPGAFRIAYQGKDPRIVAQVANQIAELYIDENSKSREGQAQETSEFLDSQLAEAKGRLDRQEVALRQFKLKFNGELPEQEGALISTLGRLQVELETNRDILNRAQASEAILESNLAAAQAALETPPSITGETTATVPPAQPRKPSDELQSQLSALSARYGPAHPDVKRVEVELARQKAAEAGQQADVVLPKAAPLPERSTTPSSHESPDARGQSRERLATLQAQIAVAEKEIAFRNAEQSRITGEMDQYSARVSHLPLREQALAQVTRDYEISKESYRSLLDKKLAARMASDLEHGQQPERFTLLDPARVPEKPQRPKRPLLYAAGGLLSLAIALLAGIGLEVRRGKLLGQWELPPQIPVLARLPHIVALRAAD